MFYYAATQRLQHSPTQNTEYLDGGRQKMEGAGVSQFL